MVVGYFVLVMGYFGVQWPVILGYSLPGTNIIVPFPGMAAVSHASTAPEYRIGSCLGLYITSVEEDLCAVLGKLLRFSHLCGSQGVRCISGKCI